MNIKSNNIELSGLISSDSFFYVLYQDNKPHLYQKVSLLDFKSTVDQLHAQHQLGKTRFAISNQVFSIIPQSGFSADHIKNYLTADCGIIDENDYIFRSDIAENQKVRVAYGVKRDTIKMINEHFDNPTLCHFMTSLIDREVDNVAPELIEVVFSQSMMSIVAFQNGKLKLANRYDVNDEVAILYYISLVSKSLKFDFEKMDLRLSGTIDRQSDIFNMLGRYFRNLSLEKSTFKLSVNEVLKGHIYYPLNRIAECA